MLDDFEKHIYPITRNKKTYFIVDGADLSDKDERDFVLCEKDRMLFFTSLEAIKNYILHHVTVDDTIMKEWAEYISEEILEEEINIDEIISALGNATVFTELSDEVENGILEFLSILRDYMEDYYREMVERIFHDKDTDLFWEYWYDKNIWKDRKKEAQEGISKLNYSRFADNIKQYIDFFYEKKKVISE